MFLFLHNYDCLQFKKKSHKSTHATRQTRVYQKNDSILVGWHTQPRHAEESLLCQVQRIETSTSKLEANFRSCLGLDLFRPVSQYTT